LPPGAACEGGAKQNVIDWDSVQALDPWVEFIRGAKPPLPMSPGRVRCLVKIKGYAVDAPCNNAGTSPAAIL